MNQLKVFSVSEFTGLVKDSLSQIFGRVIIEGEVTGYRQRRGMDKLVFFEIKDDSSRLTVFMLDYELDIEIEDGMAVRVIGSPSLFKKNSGFHLRAIKVLPVGEGALAKALALLKAKLEQEGLFAPERKRQLPSYPERIALITSPDAAAYTDVMRVLTARWPLAAISFIPVQVQGDASATSIVRGFDVLKQLKNIDVAILTRGGGSLEDLQSFNAESVARAVYAATTPVIVGVGHERDWTIADLVADVRAATPSNAAELATPDREELIGVISSMERTIHRGIAVAYESYQSRYRHAVTLLWRGPQAWRQRFQRVLDALLSRFTHQIQQLNLQRASLERVVRTLSPQATLERGYSITTDAAGHPVRSIKDIKKDDALRTRLASGTIESNVTKTYGKEND